MISFLLCGAAVSGDSEQSDGKAAAVHVEATGSGEEDVHGGDRSGDLLDLLWRFLTFTVLVILLVVVARKARLADYLSARSNDIRKRLEDLQGEKEDAEKKCRDMEGILRDFESKRKELLEEYRKEGIAERDRIIEEARVRVKQIITQSEIAIDQEIRSARNRLKQDIAEMAVGEAREIIKKEITEKDNDDLINEFIERVRGAN